MFKDRQVTGRSGGAVCTPGRKTIIIQSRAISLGIFACCRPWGVSRQTATSRILCQSKGSSGKWGRTLRPVKKPGAPYGAQGAKRDIGSKGKYGTSGFDRAKPRVEEEQPDVPVDSVRDGVDDGDDDDDIDLEDQKKLDELLGSIGDDVEEGLPDEQDGEDLSPREELPDVDTWIGADDGDEDEGEDYLDDEVAGGPGGLGRTLEDRFRRCRTHDQLSALIENNLTSLNNKQLTIAVANWSRLTSRLPEEHRLEFQVHPTLAELAICVNSRVATMDPSQLATCCRSFMHLEYLPPSLVLGLTRALEDMDVRRFPPRHLGSLIRSLGNLMNAREFAAVEEEARPQVDSFILEVMSYYGEPQAGRLADFSATDLSSIMYGLAKMGWTVAYQEVELTGPSVEEEGKDNEVAEGGEEEKMGTGEVAEGEEEDMGTGEFAEEEEEMGTVEVVEGGAEEEEEEEVVMAPVIWGDAAMEAPEGTWQTAEGSGSGRPIRAPPPKIHVPEAGNRGRQREMILCRFTREVGGAPAGQ